MMGADRVVFHPGSCAKVERGWAVKQSVSNFKTVLKAMDEGGIFRFNLLSGDDGENKPSW